MRGPETEKNREKQKKKKQKKERKTEKKENITSNDIIAEDGR